MKYFSVIILILFFILIALRSMTLKRKGITAIVFGETDRNDFFLVPLFILFIYTVFACTFNLPIPPILIKSFWISKVSDLSGILLCVAGILGFSSTLISFGDSFRVGIDEKHPDKLVTSGMFAISRNPIYISFLIFFTGMFLLYPNLVIICVLILLSIAIHRQILREEAFLKIHYGKEYEEYFKKVRRYL
ncbi:hypothetical protein OXPF_23180 [Oxobacter pfennigii]|uniref:Isoprenylcysteine carboxyl methyltransferase (ICMT) family protein n=1 Tax=Oxobacter pfennigii TaxID=36849 RepID=A0A0P8W8V6_9CLOT|nr:isoprenylcysteine carboxylmethyltransferase family protein [Oxobacter pfennigii]KPU44150.1 hypothetical protein OXPF_23180 [Oxobacter pfennigii]